MFAGRFLHVPPATHTGPLQEGVIYFNLWLMSDSLSEKEIEKNFFLVKELENQQDFL